MSTFDVSQLNRLFKDIDAVSGGNIGSRPNGNSPVSYNDVAWFANAIATASTEEATPEQKANAIKGMAEKAINVFEKIMEKIGNNEKNVAKKEVSKENKASQELVEKSKKLEAKLDGSLGDIQANIEDQTVIVTEAQEILAITQESIKEKQKEIEAIIADIEKKQQELAAAETPEEKAAILGEIQGYAGDIAEISITIEDEAETIANLTEAVDDTVADIEASTQKLAETEQAGIQELGEQAAEAGKLGTDVTKTATTGGVNQVEEKALEAAAETSSANPVTGASLAPKLYMAANDKGQAASTRLQSIAGNISKLAQGIGGLSNATQVLAGFQNTIGGALNSYSELFGQWDAQLQPAIISLGTFNLLSAGLDELNTAVETDLSNLGADSEEVGAVQKSEEMDNEGAEEKSEQAEEGKLETETEKFDTQKLRTFGI